MDFFVEPSFFVLLVPIVCGAVALGIAERPLRRYGLVASLAMLFLLFFRTPAALAYAAAYIAGSLALYLWARGPMERKEPQATSRYRIALALQLAPLVIYKVGVVFKPDFPGFLGISYITFKAVQVLIETSDGLIKQMSPEEYLYFLAFFPTFTSGPILRSRAFVADVREALTRNDYLERLYRSIGWFALGAVYKFVGSALAQWGMWFVPSVTHAPALSWLATVFFYGLDLFFDFAGYSDMAMGLGLALGVEVPRNFHMPFVATDIKEFWDRWHMSLSTWLRDFVFMRFSRFSMKKKLFKSRQTTACVGFLLNMTLMGLWHGITWDYLVYGIYHGALLAGVHYYQQTSKFHKAHKRDGWYRGLSWVLTMVAVFFGFALFGGYVVSPLLGR